jgi:hypothetical protein
MIWKAGTNRHSFHRLLSMDLKDFIYMAAFMTVLHLTLFPVAWWVVTKPEALRRWMRERLDRE